MFDVLDYVLFCIIIVDDETRIIFTSYSNIIINNKRLGAKRKVNR